MADRRVETRIPLILAAEVAEYPTGVKLSARTSDVSRSGCYVDTLNPMPKGSAIRVRLMQRAEVFEVTGKGMYVSPGLGMGIAFDQPVPPGQLAILDRWLEAASTN